jgi:hypothetical protein
MSARDRPSRKRHFNQTSSDTVNEPHGRHAYVTVYCAVDQSRPDWTPVDRAAPRFEPNADYAKQPAIRRGEAVFTRIDKDYEMHHKHRSGAVTQPGKLMPLTVRLAGFCGFEGMSRETDLEKYKFIGLTTDDFGWDSGKNKGFALYIAGMLSAWNNSNKRIQTGDYVKWVVPQEKVHYKIEDGKAVPLYRTVGKNQFDQGSTDWHMPGGIVVVDHAKIISGEEIAHAKVGIGGEPGKQIEVLLLDQAALGDLGCTMSKAEITELRRMGRQKAAKRWFGTE